MSEMDAFELRVADTLLWYADDVSTTVDAAAVANRVVLEHPRTRARRLTLPWTLRPVPALAWLVFLGLVVTSLVAAALFVGSQRPAVVGFTCPAGTDPDKPGPVDQARPLEERGAMAFDRRAGRVVAVMSDGYSVETWTFDVCTNTWTQMHPDREPPAFEWAELVYDVDSDLTIATLRNDRSDVAHYDPQTDTWTQGETTEETWAYDLQGDAWTEKRAAPMILPVFLAYDPVSGLVVAAEHSDRNLVSTYDVETDTWTPIQQANALPDYAVIAYDASVDRLIAYADGTAGSPPYETWLFDIRTGTWSRSTAERPTVGGWFTAPGLVYNEAAERTVVFLRGPLTAYDATADRWEILAEPEAVSPNFMVYDPVNRRLVGWGSAGMGPPPGAVAALDLATGEWTVLLGSTPGAR